MTLVSLSKEGRATLGAGAVQAVRGYEYTPATAKKQTETYVKVRKVTILIYFLMGIDASILMVERESFS